MKLCPSVRPFMCFIAEITERTLIKSGVENLRCNFIREFNFVRIGAI
jgi:hypothetical protein